MKIFKSTFGAVAAISLLVAQAAHAAPAKTCNLGSECIISYDYTLAIPVTKSQGTQYTCHLSLKVREFGTSFRPDGDFDFPTRAVYLAQKWPEQNEIIQGRFNGENGFIDIDAIPGSGTGWATVQCTKL